MDLQEVMQYLEQNQQQMLDLTIKLAEINSGTFNVAGIDAVAKVMQQEMASLDCEHVSMPVAAHQQINQFGESVEYPLGHVHRFWKRAQAPLQILIMGHLDTVYSPEHKFQLTKRIGGDILHGPGVADMKGGLVILLWALRAFEQLPQATNIAEIIKFRANHFKLGFVFEPAMDEKGTLASARKASGTFTFVMRGKEAHAGRNFHDGRNAICKMAEVIAKLNALNGLREEVTINVGFIHGGEAVNVVPGCCVCKVNARIPRSEDADWLQEQFNKIVHEFNKAPDYNLELHGRFYSQPKLMDAANTKLYSIVQEVGGRVGQQITWQPSGGTSDGNHLSEYGLPNVDTLGVRGGKIHSTQEFLIVPSLLERAKLFTNILFYLSENGFK